MSASHVLSKRAYVVVTLDLVPKNVIVFLGREGPGFPEKLREGRESKQGWS